MEREGFIFYQSFWNATRHLPEENQKNALMMIVQYGIDGVEPEATKDPIAYAMFLMAKPQLDANNKRFENGRLGGRPPKEKPSDNLTITKPKAKEKENVKEKEKENVNISTNVDTGASPDTGQEKTSSSKKETVPHTLSPTSAAPLSHKRDDIDTLLDTLRLTAEGIGAVYDKKQERMFAKHILDAIEFGSFAEKVHKTRIDAAVAVMKASVDSGYWKGVCAGPMMIYQNYADVYNRFQQSRQAKESKQGKIYKLS